MTKQAQIRIVTYARVSSDKQVKEDTIARQKSVNQQTLDRIIATEKDRGVVVVGHFEDEGFNAETHDPKSAFWSQVIPLVQNKSVSHIIVTSWDRIFRGKSSELRGKIEDIFRSHKITLVADNSLTVFSGDDTQARLTTSLLTNLGAINKLESVKIMHSGRRRKLQEEGEWFLSISPFGFRMTREVDGKRKRYRYTVVHEEAEVVQQIFNRYIGLDAPKPVGATRIADWLNATFPDSRLQFRERNPNFSIQQHWDRQAVLRTLRNPMYAGELRVRFDPTDKVAGFSEQGLEKIILVDPIVGKDVFAKAQDRLIAVRQKLVDERAPRKPDNWLHGLIRCPECERRLVGRLQKFRWYACEGLHGTMYRAEDLEARVRDIIHEFILDTVKFNETARKAAERTGPAEKELAALEKELHKAEKEWESFQAQLDSLTKALIRGLLDEEQYRRTRAEVTAEKADLEERLRGLRARFELLAQNRQETPEQRYSRLLPGLLKKTFSNSEYREILEGLGGEVVVKPVKVTVSADADPTVVEPLYKQGYLVLKDFKSLGRSPKWVYARYGNTGRKVAIDWRAIVRLPWAELRGWLPDGVEEA